MFKYYLLLTFMVGVVWAGCSSYQVIEQLDDHQNIVEVIDMVFSPLDENFDLRTKSNLTAYDIDMILEGTGLAGTGEYFIRAEEEYGVNAAFLTSIAVLESGWGTSRIFKEKNNPFGFRAYTDSPYDSAMTFNQIEDAIYTVASYLSREYLTEGGKWFRGYTVKDVAIGYADDEMWSNKIISVSRYFAKKINHKAVMPD